MGILAEFICPFLSLTSLAGTEFQAIARGQAESFGAVIRDEEVISSPSGDGFTITTDSGSLQADYLMMTEGESPVLANSLGLETDPSGATAALDVLAREAGKDVSGLGHPPKD